ncbi:hypothetical protein D3C75_718740 [compost metagenome]
MAETSKLAEQDYMSGMKYKAIAEKYGVSLNTVKSWKKRHGWNRDKGAPVADRVHPNRGGAPPGNQNAAGNKGGSAPKGNKNAEKHGFYAKYLPAESLEIMEQLQSRAPLDILWDNIMIQYTAIIRAQQIMYVKDRDDSTTTKISETNGDKSWGEKWEVQQAWDKQASFLTAQSRAMTTLQGMIKQYDELLKTDLATEEQKARIDVLKAKVPNKDGVDPNAQITALADLINNPVPERVIDDD